VRLPDARSSRAIFVGTAHYGDDALPDLPGVLGNLGDLVQRLTHENSGGFLAEHCTVITDPESGDRLGARMAEIAEQAEDTLLVYYAGHGLVDAYGDRYLGLSSTLARRLAFTAMPYSIMRRVLRESPAANRVLILDCCFSGRAIEAMTDPDSAVSGQIDIDGVYTLTSAPANQTANAPTGARHTAFTGELLRFLGDGLRDGPELLTLGQIYRHLLRALNARGLPKPQRRGTGTSDQLALVRNVAWAASQYAAGFPIEIARALQDKLPEVRYEAIAMLATLVRMSDGDLAQAALDALRELTDDDSRRVATAATKTLQELRPEPAPSTTDIPVEPSTKDNPAPGRTAIAVGIDFGTTNSAISVLEDGEPVLVANSEGSRKTPSVVAFGKTGEVFVGQPAKNQAVSNVDRTYHSVKRHLGTDWTTGPIDGRSYTAQEIAARVLVKLKLDAEAYLDAPITDVVLTVPAYFNELQRQATKEAGEIAGLRVLRLLSEPTAAALAYGLGNSDEDLTVLVCDLGGGTFDVSLLEIGDGVLEVRATSGDDRLGGDDWDQRIVDRLVQRFRLAHGVDLSRDRIALQRVREAAEKAKIDLSSSTSTTINLPYLAMGAGKDPLHLDETLSRAEFQTITADLLERTRAPLTDVFTEAGIGVAQVDHILLAGGGAHMPAFVELVRELMGGASPKQRISPGEIVADGAALQAGVLNGDIMDVLLLDVTPLSLGVETKGGVFTKLIPRNTSLPTLRKEVFTTAEDNQPSIQIKVFQGEREIAEDNRWLGTFELTGILPAPRGVPQFEVTFDIDANGVMHVSARDLGTGREQSIKISGGAALPDDEIRRMVRDAELSGEQDRIRRELAELRNRAETMVYQTEEFIQEHDTTVPGFVLAEVRQSIIALRTALGSSDVRTIEAATEKLAEVSRKIGVAIYGRHNSLG
jgi:molecular chaperone DnaK